MLPRHTIERIDWFGLSFSVRRQPGVSSYEKGSTSWGTASSSSTVRFSRSFGTITSNSTASSGAAVVGRT